MKQIDEVIEIEKGVAFVPYKENTLCSKTKLVFNAHHILNKRPEGNRCSPWGTVHLLLYLQLLRDIENGVLSPDQEVLFLNNAQQEFGALRSTKGQAGERRLLSDVLNQAISFNAPDCIIALFEVYGGWETTQKKLNQLASVLNVSLFSRLSHTGRSKERQLTNIYDYYKIGLAFLELTPVSHYYIKNREYTIHEKKYTPPLNDAEESNVISSIFWGTNQSDSFIFVKEDKQLKCILTINAENIEDTMTFSIEEDKETFSNLVEKREQTASYSGWLKESFEGYYLNESLANKMPEVAHVTLDLPNITRRNWENVAVVSLSASHYRALIPTSSRKFHANQLLRNTDLKDKLSLIITDEPITELKDEIAQFIVPDSLLFCYEYISYMSEIYKGKLIGITGSAGKSSTRLMLSHLLGDTGKVLENYSNANLHYPTFSLSLEINNSYDYIVFEGAASSMNSLAYGNNSYLWRPDIAIITSFGSAHAGTGIERNLRVKKQLFYGVKENGYAIINGDIDYGYLEDILAVAKSLNLTIYTYSLKNYTFGCYLKSKEVFKDHTAVTVVLLGREMTFSLKTDSDGQIQNAMATLLAIECMGLSPESYAEKFSSYESFTRILRPKALELNGVNVTLIDDTHNSSIEATINGVNHFASKKQFYKGTSLLVLGEVADLGNQTVTQHKRIGPAIDSAKADKVILFGDPFKSVELNTQNVVYCETKEEIVAEVERSVVEDSFIFVKGSHGIGFYEVVDLLENKSSIREEKNK